ncbi:OmpA family protein [uncultured Desulfosarcina sp.]|uniref:OmpA family protein n=1 Tax=uncultured Desulfosarcina sp. TaxID=218289 RepID=UPI0029C80E7C|nr:OmpA family protein [uncultured Desulfosarcina sp.]
MHKKAQAWSVSRILFMTIFLVSCSATRSVVVLLPDSEGRVGDLRVYSSQGEVQLDQAYQSVALDPQAKSKPSSSAMERQEIANRFGDALAVEPEIPTRLDFFTLYYETDSVELTPDSSRSMEAVIAFLKQSDVREFYVIGHTDRLGSKAYNWKLSKKRAITMKRLLVAGGIPSDRISVSFLGETEPQIETDDEVQEPLNRRVRIIVKRRKETSHDRPIAP